MVQFDSRRGGHVGFQLLQRLRVKPENILQLSFTSCTVRPCTTYM